MSAPIAIDEVSRMLGRRAPELARELLPYGRRDGHEWRCGSLGGEAGSSMAFCLSGVKAGVWADFASGEAGDALDLVAAVRFGGSKKDALAWSRHWLGVDTQDPGVLARAQAAAPSVTDRVDEDAEQARRSAHRLWLNAQERIAGTPVEDYLGGRGIDLASLERQPRAIRYHPALYNHERDERLPAMVTAITGPGVPFMAVHRTWLEQAGPGDWRKARVTKPKMVLGGFRAGYMALWRGASGKPMADAPTGEVVDVTEGIEDALTVAMACPESRVIAAVSVSNMANIVLPPQIRCVRLWRDNDVQGRTDRHARGNWVAFDRAVSAHLARGLQVLIADPGADVKDVNELLMRAAL